MYLLFCFMLSTIYFGEFGGGWMMVEGSAGGVWS